MHKIDRVDVKMPMECGSANFKNTFGVFLDSLQFIFKVVLSDVQSGLKIDSESPSCWV